MHLSEQMLLGHQLGPSSSPTPTVSHTYPNTPDGQPFGRYLSCVQDDKPPLYPNLVLAWGLRRLPNSWLRSRAVNRQKLVAL